MAVKNITTLKTDTNSTITTNGARAITGALHNALLQDILDSCVNRISDVSILGLFDFSSSQTYKEGQAVIYNDGSGDQIYRANKDNGPAAFNALDFDALSSTDTNIANTDLVLTGNRTLTGSYTLSFNTTGSSLQFKNQGHGMDVVTSAVVLTNSAANTRFVLGTAGTGIVITDTLGGLGLKYNNRAVDEANVVWGTDLDHIPSIGAISEHIGLQDVNALVTTPTATEDGYAIVWDNTAGEYQLQSAGTAISGTDNYVPIFNATGDNIEDSNLRQTFATSVGQEDVNSLIFEDSGIEDNKVFKLTGSGANTSLNKLTFTFDLANSSTLLPNWQVELTANGSKFLAERATTFGSIDIDFARMQIPDGSLAQISSVRSADAPSGTPTKYFHVSSGVDYMGHKYGGSDQDPTIVSLTNNYSFLSLASEQKVAIGYATGVGSHNAHLVIQSVTGTPNQRPHLKLTGGFNEGTTTPDNGSIWLSSIDSKTYIRNNNNVNIPLEGLKSVISNSQASTATLTPDANSEDIEVVTALAAAMTIAAPTGTPVEGQKLVIKIKDDGTSRALTWNAIFQVIGTTLPTATTISKWHRIECEYNVTDTKWDVIDVKEQA